jgi:hypothetical protein
MDLSIKTGDVLILFLLKMILFTIFLSIHHLEGIAEVVFCFFKEGNAKSIIYKIMNDFTNEHSHLLFFYFSGFPIATRRRVNGCFFPPMAPRTANPRFLRGLRLGGIQARKLAPVVLGQGEFSVQTGG